MSQVLQFAILGLGIGAVYALLGNGLVLIYRGSGILNFAQGAYAMVGAYLFYELHDVHRQAFAPSFAIAAAAVGLVGALTHLLVMRPLRQASPLARLIATLGILAVLLGAATIRYGANLIEVPSSLPQGVIHWGSIAFSEDRLYLLGIATALTVALWAATRFTTLGLVPSAVAENQRAAAALGWSPDLVATATWTLGAVLAAVAGIMVVPLSGLAVSSLTLVVVAAMAAGLVSGFSSFPVTLAAAVVIGIVQSEMARYVQQPGWADAFPFLAIMAVLIVRGKTLPVRSHMLERLPGLGTGVVKARVIVPLSLALGVAMLTILPQNLTIAINVQLTVAVILLSVIVVTGYTGQLSLAQFTLAGIGAYLAGARRVAGLATRGGAARRRAGRRGGRRLVRDPGAANPRGQPGRGYPGPGPDRPGGPVRQLELHRWHGRHDGRAGEVLRSQPRPDPVPGALCGVLPGVVRPRRGGGRQRPARPGGPTAGLGAR